MAVAEQIASATRTAEAVVVAFGANCWWQTPTTLSALAETLDNFLSTLRSIHRGALPVLSPIVTPDAESDPNLFGASLGNLRASIERTVSARRDSTLLRARDLVMVEQLADGVHPDDDGHCAMGEAITRALAAI